MRRLIFATLLLVAANASGAEISLDRCKRLAADLAKGPDPWEAKDGDASALAWNESYTLHGLLDLFEVTNDASYLDELVRRGDRMLSHRDDVRGFKDWSGKSHKRWSIATKYTVADGILADANGRPVIKLRSTPLGNNDVTGVVVSMGDAGFTIRVTNKFWKRSETFEDLSLDPAGDRYVEKIINDPTPRPQPAAGDRGADRSQLIRVDHVHDEPGPSGRLVAQTIRLTPRWHAHVGYVGIIYHPLLRFALLVKEREDLKQLQPAAARFVAAADESYDDILSYWRNGPGEEEGHYIGCVRGGPAPYDNVPQAFNYLARQACSELALFQLTGNERYKDHVTRLANLLKRRLDHNPEGDLYVWKYWYEPLTTGWKPSDDISDHYPSHEPYTAIEDVSHGTLEIAMVLATADAGMVFDKTDLRRFANTFLKNVVLPDRSGFAGKVDGSDAKSSYRNMPVAGWLPLAEVDPAVYEVCRELYAKRERDHFLSLAGLLKWEKRLAEPQRN